MLNRYIHVILERSHTNTNTVFRLVNPVLTQFPSPSIQRSVVHFTGYERVTIYIYICVCVYVFVCICIRMYVCKYV